jgi:integrase
MATLQKRMFGKKEIYQIQFRDEHKRKKTITLPATKFTEKTAFELKEHIEVLIYEKINEVGVPNRKTRRWVEDAPLEIKEKLAKHGLCLLPSTHTLQELWDTFFDKIPLTNENTRKTSLYAMNRFFSFSTFKPNELIDKLTKEQMEAWKRFLLEDRNYLPATVAGTIARVKVVFNWAVKQGWLKKSPLDGVGKGSYRNEEKDRIITQEEYRKLLDAAICQEWRVIITLARICGLRPCEILTLRWSDINRVDRFTVYSPKMKGRKRYKRDVPLFPELGVELEKLRAIPGNENQEYVINRYLDREKCNLVTQFNRIAKRACIGPIPRPFDNMRMSRANEIRRNPEWGTKLENLWIGHSAKVADEYYFVATDDDYAAAADKKEVDKTETKPPEAATE